MDLAFFEAKQGVDTWTNPQVGAVIVKDGRILAQGHHEKFGGPHAEINTLNHLKKIADAKDATMYVTLEPCSHFGKTPPCVQKVVEVGIKKVVVGQKDPNPIVGGNGIKYLLDHDVDVEVLNQTGGINQAYNFYYQNNRPLVTLKYAMTLDGKINQSKDIRTLITGEKAYQDSQELRSRNQAILIGERTLKIDDPQLTVRFKKMNFPPFRIVVIRDVNTVSPDLQIFQDKSSKVFLLSQTESKQNFPDNVQVEVSDNWTPDNILEFLTKLNIESLLVEGGSQLQAAFVAADRVDQVVIYQAPKIFGGQSLPAIRADYPATEIDFLPPKVTELGADLKIELRRDDRVYRNN